MTELYTLTEGWNKRIQVGERLGKLICTCINPLKSFQLWTKHNLRHFSPYIEATSGRPALSRHRCMMARKKNCFRESSRTCCKERKVGLELLQETWVSTLGKYPFDGNMAVQTYHRERSAIFGCRKIEKHSLRNLYVDAHEIYLNRCIFLPNWGCQ